MTVIEFAHIKLLDGTTSASASLKANLRKVKQVIEAYNHLPTNFLAEREDPAIMYVVGSWASKAQHADGFAGSPAQREILGLVRDQMTIDWQHYVELEYAQVPMAAPVLSVATYGLRRGEGVGDGAWERRKGEFRKVFAEPSKEFVDAVVAAKGLQGSAGGWNIAKEREELLLWVQFSGWDTEENAKAFYASRECRDLMEAAERLGVEADVKHGTMYDLG